MSGRCIEDVVVRPSVWDVGSWVDTIRMVIFDSKKFFIFVSKDIFDHKEIDAGKSFFLKKNRINGVCWL